MDTPTHTLVETNTTPKKAKALTIEKGLMIRPPYSDWDPKKMLIGSPVAGTSKTGGIPFSECKIEYNYTLPDGSSKKARLQIDFPNEPGKRCKSTRGITEILVYMDPKEVKKLPANFIRPGTGKHQVTCTLTQKVGSEIDPVVKALLRVMRDIYEKCLVHMHHHGTHDNGTGLLTDGEYAIPSGLLGTLRSAQHLRNPVMYSTEEVINQAGGKMDKIIPDGPVRTTLSVRQGGRYGASIVNKDAEPVSPEDLLGQGFEHVPLMTVDNLYIGAKSKIRLGMDSTIITQILPPRSMQQQEALDDIKRQEALNKTHLADIQSVFDFGDEVKTTPEPEDEYEEETQLTVNPPRLPVSPVKTPTKPPQRQIQTGRVASPSVRK